MVWSPQLVSTDFAKRKNNSLKYMFKLQIFTLNAWRKFYSSFRLKKNHMIKEDFFSSVLVQKAREAWRMYASSFVIKSTEECTTVFETSSISKWDQTSLLLLKKTQDFFFFFFSCFGTQKKNLLFASPRNSKAPLESRASTLMPVN